MANVNETPFAGATVLLAEDDQISQMIVEVILTDAGLTVHVVENGQEALNRMEAGGIDVVLMDCEMPVLNGLAATEQLRADPRFQRLPILAMSAHTGEAEVQRCLKAGMNGHIAKPIEPDSLLSALRRSLALSD